MSRRKKTSTKIPTVRCYENLNVFTEGNTQLGKQGSTSACDRGGGNMRGRGQMCQLAWVSVEIIGTVHREREAYTEEKQDIFTDN